MPETEDGALVYELSATDVERLLAGCPYFEYYLLAPDLSWLVAESDHNVYFVCRAA